MRRADPARSTRQWDKPQGPAPPALDTPDRPSDCTDEGADGFLDLTFRFDTQEVVQAIEAALGREVDDGEALVLTLEGRLFDGTPIASQDVVVILNRGRE